MSHYWTSIQKMIFPAISNLHLLQSSLRTRSSMKSKTSSIPSSFENAYSTFIKWKGYPISDNSWEPISHLLNSRDLIQHFHSQYPNKPSMPFPSSAPKFTLKKRGHPKRKVNFVGTTIHFHLPDSPISAAHGFTVSSACV